MRLEEEESSEEGPHAPARCLLLASPEQRIQKDVSASVEGAVVAAASAAGGPGSPAHPQRAGASSSSSSLLGLGPPGSLAAAAAAAGDPSARLAALGRLQADFAAARAELDEVTAALRRDIAAYEAARGGGEAFMYQGRRLADTLGPAATV